MSEATARVMRWWRWARLGPDRRYTPSNDRRSSRDSSIIGSLYILLLVVVLIDMNQLYGAWFSAVAYYSGLVTGYYHRASVDRARQFEEKWGVEDAAAN